MTKFIIPSAVLVSLVFFATTIAQGQTKNSTGISGKYCEDLGFGWDCFDFKSNGKCIVTGGHSYWKNNAEGKWIAHADTVMVISFANKKNAGDTFYFYFRSDPLHNLYHDGKFFKRNGSLTKQ